MSCCGQRRQQLTLGGSEASPRPSAAGKRGVAPAGITPTVVFEYTGGTGMTVRGPLTGKVYRFDKPGALVRVDVQDARTFSGVPHVRRLV